MALSKAKTVSAYLAELPADRRKACIRFKTPEDLPLDTIGEVVASTTAAEWISIFETSRKK